jgi:DEAD/DEAH box helicase domain-containing protein
LPASEFEVLNETKDGSQQAYKHWLVYNPDGAANDDEYDGYLTTAASVMVRLLMAKDTRSRPAPLNTILFARSMRDVEKAYKLVRENLKKQAPHLADKVRSFVGARLTPPEKRDIYEGLRDGRYYGVVSTNALEAGIDIGKLDACIIAGFPFTIMRMRQMAGRVGRQNEGLVVYVPHPARPVDEYYRHNADLLLTQKPEAFVIDADNPYIARKHLNAAAAELSGISKAEAQIFGSRLDEMIREAVAGQVMRQSNGHLFGTKRNYKNLKDEYLDFGQSLL